MCMCTHIYIRLLVWVRRESLIVVQDSPLDFHYFIISRKKNQSGAFLVTEEKQHVNISDFFILLKSNVIQLLLIGRVSLTFWCGAADDVQKVNDQVQVDLLIVTSQIVQVEQLLLLSATLLQVVSFPFTRTKSQLISMFLYYSASQSENVSTRVNWSLARNSVGIGRYPNTGVGMGVKIAPLQQGTLPAHLRKTTHDKISVVFSHLLDQVK